MGDGRMVRYRLLVAGMVQGVGFRYYVNYTARLLQLTGWVRNLEDGEVEIEVQGPAGEVDQFWPQCAREPATPRWTRCG